MATTDGQAGSALAEMRILVIDDQPFVRQTIVFMLEQAGIREIAESGDGEDALRRLATPGQHYDIVFCDLQMPGRDGIEILRDLPRHQPGARVVLISGENVEVLKAAHALASEYGLQVLGSLSKPVSAEQIRTVLEIASRAAQPRASRRVNPVGIDDLRRALADGEIQLYVQPKIRIADRALDGVEALARWEHPEHGPISPSEFVPLAEEHDLIDTLTEHMLDQLFEHGQRWQEEDLWVGLACNLSMRTLRRLDLPEQLEARARRAGFSPSRVVLEITESQLSDDPKVVLDIATRLRLKKFQLAIDDFGTGYSSLHQLRRLPFSELKIDQAFVTDAADDPTARSILESSIDLARKLDMKIVAEGVESIADWELVSRLGCDLAQGFHMARPMPAAELMDWGRSWSERG